MKARVEEASALAIVATDLSESGSRLPHSVADAIVYRFGQSRITATEIFIIGVR